MFPYIRLSEGQLLETTFVGAGCNKGNGNNGNFGGNVGQNMIGQSPMS